MQLHFLLSTFFILASASQSLVSCFVSFMEPPLILQGGVQKAILPELARSFKDGHVKPPGKSTLTNRQIWAYGWLQGVQRTCNLQYSFYKKTQEKNADSVAGETCKLVIPSVPANPQTEHELLRDAIQTYDVPLNLRSALISMPSCFILNARHGHKFK